MAEVTTKKTDSFAAAGRKLFLAKLAETCNVTRSARAANVGTQRIYDERLRSAAFRDQWQFALSEGYVRIETDQVAKALRGPRRNLTEAQAKAEAAADRINMQLLAMHKASVRGGPVASPQPTRSNAEIRAGLEARFKVMRDRLRDDAGE